jgi:hypothetical protein
MFSGVVWGDYALAECATEAEAFAAVSRFAQDKATDIYLITTPDLLGTLKGQNLLYNYAARCGAQDMRVGYAYDGSYCFISQIQYYDIPYAAVADAQEFVTAVEGFAAENTPAFDIIFTPSFYDAMKADNDVERVMLALSKLDRYRQGYSSYSRSYSFTEVTYSTQPRMVCETEEDIVNAIRQMGSAGVDAFNLILTESLYETVHEGYFKRLQELNAEGGMTDFDLSYNFSNYVLYYTNAVISAEVTKLSTIDEVNSYMQQKAALGEKEVILFLSDDLYATLMEGVSMFSFGSDGMERINDVPAHAGAFDYSFSYSGVTHIIQFHINAYYPGTAIISAIRRGDEGSLSPRLQETWQAAQAIAQACTADNPLDTARNIHDRLCEMVVYTDDESTDEDDTAIGAILNGQANCDGYSDAFYLIGTLSGLNVRYQHGDSYDVGYHLSSLLDSVTHMWNLIEIDGTWRLIDVTWDDAEEAGISYTWFNLGKDRAARMHIWNEEMTVELQPETDLSCRPDTEYLVASQEEAEAAIQAALDAKQPVFELIYADEASSAGHLDALKAMQQKAPSAFKYSWNERMLTLDFSDIEY